jgi:DNA adenine methylase
VAWPGGKDGAGVVQRLINQIPPHDVFISAFLGDCAILRKKLPAAHNIGIDLDRANVQRWLTTARVPDLALYCCCGIDWLKHEFDLHLVASSKSAATVSPRPKPPNPATVDRPPPKYASLDPAAAAAVIGGPVRPATLRRFVYIDAPYLRSSRRSSKRLYRHELTDEDHAELLDVALRLPCLVMISHYPHQLYDHTLRDWRSFTFTSQTRSGRRAIEKVWCNYEPPAELHDARFVGGNKRERERVRRRVRNWVSGLGRMQPAERQAILDEIHSRYFQRPLPANDR